jgi:hypothetical protein
MNDCTAGLISQAAPQAGVSQDLTVMKPVDWGDQLIRCILSDALDCVVRTCGLSTIKQMDVIDIFSAHSKHDYMPACIPPLGASELILEMNMLR